MFRIATERIVLVYNDGCSLFHSTRKKNPAHAQIQSLNICAYVNLKVNCEISSYI